MEIEKCFKLPIFSGINDQNMSCEQFIFLIEEIGKVNSWNDQDILHYGSNCLVNDALQWYRWLIFSLPQKVVFQLKSLKFVSLRQIIGLMVKTKSGIKCVKAKINHLYSNTTESCRTFLAFKSLILGPMGPRR